MITFIIILCSFLLVGTPIKYNCLTLNIAIILVGIAIGIYRVVIKKEKIKLQKIDIVIFVFYISPIIPLMFNTYSSLEETMISLIRNISLFNLYILAKKEKENNLLDAIIAGGVILAIIGIDEMTVRYIYKLLETVGIPNVMNIENRMFSSLGYANSFAVIMAVEILIVWYKIKLDKQKIHRIIYSVLIGLFSICLILSYSRTVILMLILLCLIYAIIIKRKKIYIVATGILVILVCIIYCVGLKFATPLVIFNTQEDTNQVRRDIYDVQSQKEYVFKFDIEANSRFATMENYSISIVEEDKYYDSLLSHEIKFGNFKGEKEIKFTTTEDTVKMVIYFNTYSDIGQKGLKINSLEINGEKFNLKYAYLPIKLVERVQSISVKNKSVWERGVYFSDSLKIIKDNWLFGLGAKGWLYNYERVQSYVYTSTEPHSFILQTFIDYGIIGFSTLIVIITYSMILILKKKKNINEIDLAFILLTFHSFIDFDMSFYCIMVLWIILLTCINKNKNEISETKFINSNIIQTGIIIINILAVLGYLYTLNIQKSNESDIESIQQYVVEEKYDEVINKIKEYSKREKNSDFSLTLEMIDYSKVNDNNIEYIYNILKEQKLSVDTKKNIERSMIIKRILETSKNQEYLSKFAQIVISEYKETLKNIFDQEKNRLSNGEINKYIEQQKDLYKYSKQFQN